MHKKQIPEQLPLDHDLKAQLDAIRQEEVPERLLALARRLQARLRQDVSDD